MQQDVERPLLYRTYNQRGTGIVALCEAFEGMNVNICVYMSVRVCVCVWVCVPIWQTVRKAVIQQGGWYQVHNCWTCVCNLVGEMLVVTSAVGKCFWSKLWLKMYLFLLNPSSIHSSSIHMVMRLMHMHHFLCPSLNSKTLLMSQTSGRKLDPENAIFSTNIISHCIFS